MDRVGNEVKYTEEDLKNFTKSSYTGSDLLKRNTKHLFGLTVFVVCLLGSLFLDISKLFPIISSLSNVIIEISAFGIVVEIGLIALSVTNKSYINVELVSKLPIEIYEEDFFPVIGKDVKTGYESKVYISGYEYATCKAGDTVRLEIK